MGDLSLLLCAFINQGQELTVLLLVTQGVMIVLTWGEGDRDGLHAESIFN